MDFLKIIDSLELEKIDQEQFLKPAMRSELFKKAGDFSLKAALASLPFALFAMPQIVKASTNDAVTDTLNFALTLEYLEAEFYTMGLQKGVIPAANIEVFKQISKHETSHVAFLKAALGSNAIAKPNFDFTGGKGTFAGPYADVFVNYQTFLTLSQAFEDTGVRAYKGQAGNLMSADATLTAALQIHSVEARHASIVRRIRQHKGWITQDTSDGAPAAVYGAGSDTTNYPSEKNIVQGGIDLSTLASLSGISSDNLTEAFDEPLDKATVTTIANTFIYT